jgi:predicted nucleic acid-binding protein
VIVVSDASPLIALAAVQQLDLLRILYGEIISVNLSKFGIEFDNFGHNGS